MYDTLKINIDKDVYNYKDALRLFEVRMSNVTIVQHNGITYHNGFYKNWHFKLSPYSFKASGSLTKLQFDNNLVALDNNLVWLALSKLNHALGFKLDSSTLERIDIGLNLEMDHPVHQYLQLLSRWSTAKRHTVSNETVFFEGNNTNVLFYDKVAETKRGTPMSRFFLGKNLLRFEVRFKKNLGNMFNMPKVTVKDLKNREFQDKLIKRWQYEYTQVSKSYQPSFELDCTGSKKLIESLAVLGIESMGGYDTAINYIDTKVKGNAQGKYRMSKAIKAISANHASVESVNLVEELSRKINDRANDYVGAFRMPFC